MELWEILTIVFGILASYFAFHWKKGKNIIEQIGLLFDIIYEALKDDTLTKEELKSIIEQVKNIIDEFKKKKKVSDETIEKSKRMVKMIKDKKI